MTLYIKKFLYIVNILTVVYMVFAVLFAGNSIITNYKKFTEISYQIEAEYDEVLGKYKKIIVFILKNDLPENMDYFNSIASVTYNLSPVKEFKISKAKEIILSGSSNKISDNYNVRDIECYNSNCIEVLVDRRELLDRITKGKGYGEITAIPIKKATILKMSVNSFLDGAKNLVFVTLLCLFILYLFQSLFLFIKNFRLSKLYNVLLITSDKNNQELIKQSTEYNKLYESVIFTQEVVDEYFTHYVHQLISRDICIVELDLTDIFQRIEKFFSYQITKQGLKLILDYSSAIKHIKSDNETVFIVLLNLTFKAIYRSKMFSEILIKIFQIQDAINIEIQDVGYEYDAKLSNKIQIYKLPNPILKNLCQKLKIEFKEIRKDQVNIISIKIRDHKEKIKKVNKTNDNIIKFNPYAK